MYDAQNKAYAPAADCVLLLSACSAKGGYSQQASIASAEAAASAPSPAPVESSSG